MSEFENWDADEEKAVPTIPQGTYDGEITKATVQKDHLLVSITLGGNSGVLSDGTSSVDGSAVFFRLYFPKPGDEDQMSGKLTKREWKVNNIIAFAKQFGLPAGSAEFVEAINSGELLATPVTVQMTLEEWKGQIQERVSKLTPQ